MFAADGLRIANCRKVGMRIPEYQFLLVRLQCRDLLPGQVQPDQRLGLPLELFHRIDYTLHK